MTTPGGTAYAQDGRAWAGCPGKDRLGPYATKEEAENALELVRERNEEWDAADDDD